MRYLVWGNNSGGFEEDGMSKSETTEGKNIQEALVVVL